jgi:Na+/proline symporter
LQIELAVTVSAAVAIAYTVSGGLLADVVTDLVQGIVVILGLAALGAVVLATAGAADAFAAVPVERLNPLGRGAGWVASLEAWVVPIGGSLVAQEMVSRVVAARSERVARAATLGAAGLYLAVGLIPAALGLIGPSLLPGLADPERILPALALRYLPTWLYVLFAGALVSAILSTVDSALLAASSLVSHNVIVSLHPELGDRARILCARAGVVVFGVVAWALAVHGGGVHELVKQASSFGSGGVLVVVLMALFTRVGGARSAEVALLAGLATWAVGTWGHPFPGAFTASIVVSLVAYLLFAGIGPGPGRQRR